MDTQTAPVRASNDLPRCQAWACLNFAEWEIITDGNRITTHEETQCVTKVCRDHIALTFEVSYREFYAVQIWAARLY